MAIENFDNTTIDVQTLKPFKKFIMTIGELPTNYIDSLSYAELLTWFCDYLQNKVIPVVDTNAAALKELQDYFNNLDVQDEIDNKLDEMAEDGTLEEIMASYLNTKAVFCFDNVASMKEATNLIDGSYAETLGYYSKNDSGSSLYKIRNITNDDVIDNATIIPIGSETLIAELIVKDNLNPIQFGCYGDNTHDDTTNLQKVITFCENNKIKLGSSGDKIYKISSTLNVDTLLCNFNNATITSANNINLVTINSTNYYGQLEKIKFDCAYANAGIYIQNGRKKTFKDLIFENISNYGFYYNAGYEILLADSHFKGNNTSGTVGIYCNSSDSKFENIIMIDCHTAIYNKGLNYFNFVHAWIYTKNIVETSIFADLQSNRAYFNQCYSDTYGITFNCNGGTFIATQLEVFLNDSIWTADLSSPYVVYFTDSSKRTVFNQLTNSRLNGVRQNQHINLSNEDISMIQLSNNNKTWVDKYVGIRGELTGLSANITNVIKNEIDYQDGIVTLTFWAQVQVNPNDTRNISTAILPDYLQPEVPYNGNCINCADVYQTGQNSYVYISTNLQATLNWIDGATNRYIKINATYKSKQFANI